MVFLPVCLIPVGGPVVVKLSAGVTGLDIQRALDALPATGGTVLLSPGLFPIFQPIVLRRNHQSLCGSGLATVLCLAAGANCPMIIMGEPVNNPQRTVHDLRVSNLYLDGNRRNQQRELWRLSGEGSEIRNNGIVVQNVSDSIVENVTCARCRSGGLVTTRGVRRLTVRHLTAFDNEFDGLACYQTENSLFMDLVLRDNPGAGISLDLDFDHNVISNAVLTANDLGIFMRSSRGNLFDNVSIQRSRHFGVFMAHSEEETPAGWEPVPQTECAKNAFTNLAAVGCGDAAFRINNANCTNNIIVRPRFEEDRGGLSVVVPNLVAVR